MSASVINVTRPAGAHRSWIRRHAVSLAFLAPAAIWLLFIVVWPTIDTVRLSLFNESATKFLGLTNYKTVFSTDTILTAFRNNVIWVLIFPFFVTTFGLIFAVLTERIRWATAFKALIVMPIVFSTTASALVWATIFDNSPQIGAVNAAALTISDWFNAPGAYPVSTTAGQTVADLVGSNSRAQKNGNSLDQHLIGPGGRDDRYWAEGYQPRDAHCPQGPKGGEAPANVGLPSRGSSGARFHRLLRPIRRTSCPESSAFLSFACRS